MPVFNFIGKIFLELFGKQAIQDKHRNLRVRPIIHQAMHKKVLRNINSLQSFNECVLHTFGSVCGIAIEIAFGFKNIKDVFMKIKKFKKEFVERWIGVFNSASNKKKKKRKKKEFFNIIYETNENAYLFCLYFLVYFLWSMYLKEVFFLIQTENIYSS